MKESDIFKIASYSDRLLNTLNQNKRPLTDAEILGICNRLMYIRDLLCEYKAEFLNS